MSASSFVRQVEHALRDAKTIPLWGHAPSFPKNLFSKKIAEIFPDFALQEIKTNWAEPNRFFEGYGSKSIVVSLELAPLSGAFFWIVSKEDAASLCAAMLTREKGKKGFSDPRLQEGFYRFLVLEATSALPFYPNLTARILSPQPYPTETSLVHDTTWTVATKTLRGRLLISPEFHHAFKAHFANMPISLLDSSIAESTFLSLKLQAGATALTYEEWAQVVIGDLLLLDKCTYDPTMQKGAVDVVLGNIPLFRARIRGGELKILDNPLFYEEQNSMDEKNSDNENTEFTEGESELSEEKKHMWSAENGSIGPMQKRLSAHDIPLTIAIEIGHIHMSAEKLLQIQPGNLIDLALPLEQVELTVQGKRIGKGELIKIGNTVGVKIISVG